MHEDHTIVNISIAYMKTISDNQHYLPISIIKIKCNSYFCSLGNVLSGKNIKMNCSIFNSMSNLYKDKYHIQNIYFKSNEVKKQLDFIQFFLLEEGLYLEIANNY